MRYYEKQVRLGLKGVESLKERMSSALTFLSHSCLAEEQERVRLQKGNLACSVVSYAFLSGSNYWNLPCVENLLRNHTASILQMAPAAGNNG